MLKRLLRMIRHLVETRLATRRRFTTQVLDAIEAAVRAAEANHSGELRLVVETDLDAWSIMSGKTARARALEVFAGLGVWDTQRNNGVLIYVLFADRAVEIIADRGFNSLVTAAEWARVGGVMETEFRQGRWQAGALAGVAAAAKLLARHFPGAESQDNELPNRPVLL